MINIPTSLMSQPYFSRPLTKNGICSGGNVDCFWGISIYCM